MNGLRLVFAGSPQPAVPSLHALAGSAHDVCAVITREDSAHGRKRIVTPTAVARAAHELDIRTIKANRLDQVVTQTVADLAPDLGVIVAYGGLVREPLLSTPKLGWINLHFSLLPRWRGAAPVQRAIMAGDDVTGASVFQLVPELDAGDLYGHFSQAIGDQETAGQLLNSLADGGAELLLRVIDAMAAGTASSHRQRGDVTLAPKLNLADAKIDFEVNAPAAFAQIRGVTPEPGAFFVLDGTRVKVLRAILAQDGPPVAPGHLDAADNRVYVGTTGAPLELLEVHPAGRKAMKAADWWRGHSGNSRVDR